jgi:hypothetical protein
MTTITTRPTLLIQRSYEKENNNSIRAVISALETLSNSGVSGSKFSLLHMLVENNYFETLKFPPAVEKPARVYYTLLHKSFKDHVLKDIEVMQCNVLWKHFYGPETPMLFRVECK